MPAASFPTLSLECLWHVGAMDPALKRLGSLEGAGLSVSLHPEEWTSIAKLGGNPTWELRRPGATFLHAHQMSHDQITQVLAWGVAEGLAEVRDLWRWERFDDELDTTITSFFPDEAEAYAEADDGYDGTYGTVDKVSGHRTTPLLVERARQHRVQDGDDFVLDLLLPFYAEAELSVDGVWWQDQLGPSCYSAPRGVILLAQLPHWSAKIISNPQTRAA